MKDTAPEIVPHFISRGGDMGKLIREKDWSKTTLGQPQDWPLSLQIMVSMMLDNPYGMYIAWGNNYIQLYNDSYRSILGSSKHPAALGISTKETFAEIWHTIEPMFNDAMAGKAISSKDFMLPITRDCDIEECYFDFSYSPIRKENGEVGGVLVSVIETTNKKKSESSLKKSEEAFRTMADNISQLAWMTDETGYVFWYNNRWFNYTGTTLEEVEGWGWKKVNHPDFVDAVESKLKQYIVKGEVWEDTFPLLGKDGQYKWFLSRAIPIKNAEGNVIRWFGTNTDITERMQAEEALKESENRFRKMAEETDFLIAMADESSNAIYFNKAWTDLTGRPMKDLLQFGWSDLVHIDDRDRYVNHYINSFEKRIAFSHEFRAISCNGEYRWLLAKVSPRFRTDGSFAGYISSCMDITERKLVEEALKNSIENEVSARKKIEESEQQFRQLADTLPDLVWTTDSKGNQTFASKQWKAFTGLDPYDLSTFTKMVHPEDVDNTLKIWNNSLATGNHYKTQVRLKNKNNKYCWFKVNGEAIKNEQGEIEKWVGSFVNINEQKNAEKNLIQALHKVEESEKRFRNIADNAPVLIWMTGIDKLTNFFNKEWLQFRGRTLEEEIGKGWAEGVHPDDYNRCLNIYDVAFEERKKYYMEYRLKRHDGEYRWISSTGVLRFTKGNIFEGYIGACMDIHEQVIAQKKLREDDERLNIVIKASELGTWEWNIKTDETNYSDRFLEIFGLAKKDTPKDLDLLHFFHIEDVKIRKKAFKDAFAKGILHYESRIIWNDKSTHWIQVKGKVFYDDDNQPNNLIGTLRDITDEKKQQKELQENEQRFRLLADFMPQFVWKGDAEGNLNYFNQSVYNYSGLTPEQIKQEGWLQIVHPEEQDENVEKWMHSIKTGEDFIFEHRFRRKDGVYRWQLSRAIPQKDAKGNIQMWVGTSTDIEDQKNFTNSLEKQVEQRTNELEIKNRELKKMNTELQSFAYVISHDLQEPLRKIQTFSTRILDKEYQNLSPNGKDYFDRMQKSAKRMQTLIEDLLNYSRTTTENIIFEKANLDELVKDVVRNFTEDIIDKNITVDICEKCFVYVITFQIKQLLFNLLNNSVKFARPEVKLEIKIKIDLIKGAEIKSKALIYTDKMYCHIAVTDNGIGFEEEYADKIFEVFQRLHGKSEYDGTGIGLAIVKKIVENHNGIIQVRSIVNEGTTFNIYIPSDKEVIQQSSVFI